jgi:acetyl esterase/lipase
MRRVLPFAYLRRLAAAVFVMCLACSPLQAFALSLMDPFNLPPAMDAAAVQPGVAVPYADGARQKLDVYAPQNPSGKAPVVFFIYGGGWNRGERGDYVFVGRALAARGFVVVIADYRLVPEVRYPEFLDDSAQALKWTQDNIATYGGDPQRVFLAGHSAGAYNAVMLALDPSILKEHGVTMPIRAVAALSGPFDFYPFEYGEVREAFGKAPNPEGTQPINLVTSDSPPMFLATGMNDPIVRPINTEKLAKKLNDNGVWVTTKYYDGIGHMEAVTSLGAMMRWRAPILDDMVFFFESFGAFPNNAPRRVPAPLEPAGDAGQMADVLKRLDETFQPVSN